MAGLQSTNISPQKWQFWKEISSSNHQFSGGYDSLAEDIGLVPFPKPPRALAAKLLDYPWPRWRSESDMATREIKALFCDQVAQSLEEILKKASGRIRRWNHMKIYEVSDNVMSPQHKIFYGRIFWRILCFVALIRSLHAYWCIYSDRKIYLGVP